MNTKQIEVKVPDQIKVSSLTYQILLVDDMERHHKVLGQCLTEDGVIKINKSSSQQIKDVTLLHEITHAIGEVYVCNLTEEVVERLAEGLTDVLKNSLGIVFRW